MNEMSENHENEKKNLKKKQDVADNKIKELEGKNIELKQLVEQHQQKADDMTETLAKQAQKHQVMMDQMKEAHQNEIKKLITKADAEEEWKVNLARQIEEY